MSTTIRSLAVCAFTTAVLAAGCGDDEGGGSPPSMPTITTHPADASGVPEGASVTFTVEAAGGGLEYLWELSSDDGVTWSPSTLGVLSDTYSIEPVLPGHNGLLLRCRVSNAVGEVVSNVACLDGVFIGTVIFVDAGAAGPGNGTTWGEAFPDLQDALAAAAPGNEIWVAAGTYKPTNTTVRSATFQLVSDVGVYGGFAGGDYARGRRDWSANVTTLSGDIGTAGSATDNSYHVVTSGGNATLDGFTITAGNGTESGSSGAGMLTTGSSTVTNCTFSGNTADGNGGGVFNAGLSPTFTNCTFSGNSSGNHGGGMGNLGVGTSPTVTNCTFSGNTADGSGGGIHSAFHAAPTVTNCILWGNTAPVGAEIFGPMGVATVSYSCIKGGLGGTGLIDDGGNIGDQPEHDPLFVDADGADDVAGTEDDDLRLLLGSACIDKGSNAAVPAGVTTDLGGKPRIVGLIVDMGAYESPPLSLSAPTEGRLDPAADIDITWASMVIANVDLQYSKDGGSTWIDIAVGLAANDTYTWTPGSAMVHCHIRVIDSGGLAADSVVISIAPSPAVIHVDDDALPGGHGLGWDEPLDSLASALEVAASGDEIWVAAGTYKPTDTTDRTATFQLVSGVAVYGGFAGTEVSRGERDWSANTATLSGDIGTPTVATDNSYHVVTGADNATLDGFTITAGNADGTEDGDYYGGGMYNIDSSPTVTNCTFSGNAAVAGGGMYLESGSPAVTNCTFSGNEANGGGGMCLVGGNPTVTNCTFRGNSGFNSGGGMYSEYSSLTVTNCMFRGNWTSGDGGGMHNYASSLTVTNCTFSENDANFGGGMYQKEGQSTVTNCILWENTAMILGGEIYDDATMPAPGHFCIVSYSCIEGGLNGDGCDGFDATDDGGNIGEDLDNHNPLFMDVDGADNVPGTEDDDLRLSAGSACIDAGSNAAVPAEVTTDLGGNRRIVGLIVDMGAYEGLLSLSAPTEGRLAPAADIDITWDSMVVANVDLQYSTDGGSTWIDIATGQAASDTYTWTPGSAMIRCDIRVIESGGTVANSVAVSIAPSPAVIYVDDDASPGGHGLGWDEPLDSLASALEVALAGDEIWVAAGTYEPTDTIDRNATFQLVSGVAVYGGFAGAETLRGDRDWSANVTTLSGDIGMAGSASDNSYHVVMGVTGGTLDGFTITSGNADWVGLDKFGAGMLNSGSSPTVTNCTFSGNSASDGGGMHNNSANPTVTNCTFSGNVAVWRGGGMCNVGPLSPMVTNCTFSLNEAQAGGGMCNMDSSSPTVTNCILWGNTATNLGAEIYNNASTPVVSYSCIKGGLNGVGCYGDSSTDLVGNIGLLPEHAPLFVDPDGTDDIAGTEDDDLHLGVLSGCIDAGSDAAVPAEVATDLGGNPRIMGSAADMGAYERPAPSLLAPTEGRFDPAADIDITWTSMKIANVDLQYSTDGGSTWTDIAIGQAANDTHTWTPGSAMVHCHIRVIDSDGAVADSGAISIAPSPAVIYVDDDASPGGHGLDWDEPLDSLASALEVAVSGDEIWVAAGTYEPTDTTDRDATFQLVSGVGIYGGFAGDEVSLDERDHAANVTILSGDIGTAAVTSDNSYHVVTGIDGATLDGFTVTAGNANGTGAALNGGGIYNYSSSPTVTDCTFSGNSASLGGGMYNDDSSPTVTDCTFSGSSADHGGGIYNNSANPTVTNCTFSGNLAVWRGGGMRNVGPLSPIITNCTFSLNEADSGGGMCNLNGSASTITNCILWGNTAVTSGAEIDNDASTPVVSYSCIKGGLNGAGCSGDSSADDGGNIGGDLVDHAPRFADPDGADDVAGTEDDDLHLGVLSGCIDAGSDAAVPAGVTTDLGGNPRIIGLAIDMGAYESRVVIYVDDDASPGGNGLSWDEALNDLQLALDLVLPDDEIWVAKGTYKPSTPSGRDATFLLVSGVAVYGGFAGDELSLDLRDHAANVTILSGDIGTAADASDNSYHVVTGVDGATLDGFTVTAGNADGIDSALHGGGIYNFSSSPTVTNCTFSGNSASHGGGMYNDDSSPTVTNCTFSGNSADHGGGMYNNSADPTVTNCTFSGNLVVWRGGGMRNVGPLSPTVTNCTLSLNEAESGGGMFNMAGSSPIVTNCILWGNTATNLGNEIYNDASTPVVSYSCIEGGLNGDGCYGDDSTGGLGNIGDLGVHDPLFMDADGADDVAGTEDDDLHLGALSGCIDAADPATTLTEDIEDSPRPAGSGYDMGAYEYQ